MPGRLAPFPFYRAKDQREIDFVIEAEGVLYPVEIKRTASPGRDALRGMAALERQGVPLGEGVVICLVLEAIPLSRSVQAVPIGWL